jgi:hypothetical protein
MEKRKALEISTVKLSTPQVAHYTVDTPTREFLQLRKVEELWKLRRRLPEKEEEE